jgi:hypothetical protein
MLLYQVLSKAAPLKNHSELFKIVLDDSNCVVARHLESPLENISFAQFNYVASRGILGREPLWLRKLQKILKAVLERFADNPFAEIL